MTPSTTIQIGPRVLLVLVGAPGAGKTTWARRHFKWSEVLSSDLFRLLLVDDENDMSVTTEAFRLLDQIVLARLKRGRLAVVDAINGKPERRRELVRMAHRHHARAVAVCFELPLQTCIDRDASRSERNLGDETVTRIWQAVRQDLLGIHDEGFDAVHWLQSEAEADAAAVLRTPPVSPPD